MADILVHCCCGPCATYSTQHLRDQGHRLTALWYNPNIHPFQEHQRRLEAMQQFAAATNLDLIVEDGYDLVRYLRAVVGNETDRCSQCFRIRLTHTAEVAKAKGFAAFTTTLLISPYQKHNLLRQTGEQVAQEVGVPFLYEDLRLGFADSRRLSKEHNLYRQQYCGCIFSEWERYGAADIRAEDKRLYPG